MIRRNTAKVKRRLWNNQSISHFLSNGTLKKSLYFYIAWRICNYKKENQIFLIHKDIQNGAVAKSYMTNGLLIFGKYLRISSYIRKLFLIYDFATSPLWISLYMRKIWFSFLSVCAVQKGALTLYFFEISTGIKRRMLDISKKVTCYFLQNVWKMHSFFLICILSLQKVLLWPEKSSVKNRERAGYQKNAEFYADFKFVDAVYQKCSWKS